MRISDWSSDVCSSDLLSWSVLTPYLLDEAGKPREAWIKLVERFPERFMLGSDVVGRFDNVGKELRSFDPFLDALTEGVARKVARDNFLAVLCGSKVCTR